MRTTISYHFPKEPVPDAAYGNWQFTVIGSVGCGAQPYPGEWFAVWLSHFDDAKAELQRRVTKRFPTLKTLDVEVEQ